MQDTQSYHYRVLDLLVQFKEKETITRRFNEFISHSKDSRIHTNLNPLGAVSGRFTSSNPNIQNMGRNTPDEAQKFIDDILNLYVGVKQFQKHKIQEALKIIQSANLGCKFSTTVPSKK